MDLDVGLSECLASKAAETLTAAGFDTTPETCRNTPRAIVWWLGGSSARRRKTVLELLECIIDPEAA